MLKDWTKELRFSPPCGDGTKQFGEEFTKIQFSPPCGDCTVISQHDVMSF